MNGFLSQVASDLWSRYGKGVASLHVVLPSRRAGLFFGEALSGIIDRPVWQPSELSIDGLAEELSGLETGERLHLVAELFKVYSEFHPAETFEGFYFWGELLLGDFDSIDKYLIDADTLFSNLVDLRVLDSRFDYLSAEQRAAIERFWGTFAGEQGDSGGSLGQDGSPEQADFLRVWRTLGPVYHRFRERLRELGVAYQGMVYREAAERVLRGEVPEIPDRHYVIAGFNALSRSEQIIFEHLQKTYTTDFYWDFDNYFLLDPTQEAGRFMRDNIRRFPPAAPLSGGHDNFVKPKHVRSVSTASDVLQCKWAGLSLADAARSAPLDKNAAIVLCDEGLLTPLLWSLPPEVQSVNITMGYPLRLHPAYTALERRLVELLKARPKDWRVVSQELIRQFDEPAAPVTEPTQGQENFENAQFRELISTHLHTLADTLSTLELEITPKTYATLLRRSLQSVRVPFEGEPLQGVQIMGFLETRALDFDNIVFLSAGDGTMPGNLVGAPSMIPYSLKMAYGLPTPEHHEGVWAYHFFRLVSRARNIDLVWSSTSDERTVGEPSRYILQLDYESPHSVEKQSLKVDVNLSAVEPIVVEKQIERIPRRLSPSLFSTYLDCPLKFYFRAVAGLRPTEEPTEEVDSAMLGSILHLAMYKLYLPLVDIPNPQPRIHSLIDSAYVDEAVNSAIADTLSEMSFRASPSGRRGISIPDSISQGSISLVHKTITGYINRRILPVDADRTEDFVIAQLEEWLEAPFDLAPDSTQPPCPTTAPDSATEPRTITFFGKADRIDRLSDNTLRIVDYKTGSPAGRTAAEFQIALYSLMLSGQSAGQTTSHNVHTSLYYVRRLPESIESEGISPKIETLLQATLQELFDPHRPFSQTADPSPCEFCDFRRICRR